MSIEIPMRLPSRVNLERSHWERHKLVKEQRSVVGLQLSLRMRRPALPVTVELVRVSPKELDDDNLRGATKAIRDAVAHWLGLPDDRDPRVRWRYGQTKDEQKRPRYQAVRITIVHGHHDCAACGQGVMSA